MEHHYQLYHHSSLLVAGLLHIKQAVFTLETDDRKLLTETAFSFRVVLKAYGVFVLVINPVTVFSLQ